MIVAGHDIEDAKNHTALTKADWDGGMSDQDWKDDGVVSFGECTPINKANFNDFIKPKDLHTSPWGNTEDYDDLAFADYFLDMEKT